MKVPIHSVDDLGLALRAIRKASNIRLDDLAETVGVSKQFTSDVEHGKPTVQLGLVLKLLKELGIPLSVDIPDAKVNALNAMRAQGLRPLKKQKS
jgi:transcriptional regulator with XRE-family HTH domain